MTKPRGLFRLQTPIDLLGKMEFDYQRLTENPLDSYAAFDFFVTAAHLPEWLSKAKCAPGPPRDAVAAALRDTCEHLANGAKHWVAKEHDSVDDTSVRPPCILGEWVIGVSLAGDSVGDLLVHLPSGRRWLSTGKRCRPWNSPNWFSITGRDILRSSGPRR